MRIKSPHLRALIKMVLLVSIIAGIALSISYGLNYIYLTYGGEGIVKLIASFFAVATGLVAYNLMLDEEKRKDKKDEK